MNGHSLEDFGNAINEADVKMPFRVTGTEGRFNAMIKVEGGGVTAGGRGDPPRHRAGAARLDPNRLALRQAGYLARDPRMKGRKKYGKRARKAPRYTKR